jgi:hypothetical protein
VNLEVQRRRPRQETPSPESSAATTQADASSLPIDSAYCVLAHTPYDRPRRRLFLSLHSAVQAVQRARKRGLQAELILCKLEPVQADLDVDGEVTE